MRGEVRCAAHCPPRAHLRQGRTAAHETRVGAARMMQTTLPARRLTTLCVRARTLRDPPSSLYGCWLGHSFASGGGLTQPSDVPMIPEPTPSHSLARHACLFDAECIASVRPLGKGAGWRRQRCRRALSRERGRRRRGWRAHTLSHTEPQPCHVPPKLNFHIQFRRMCTRHIWTT